MWFKKSEDHPQSIVMICVAHCGQCQAPIYGPASIEFPRNIGTEDLMKELSAKVVNFCICHQAGEDFGMVFGKRRIPEGN